MENNRKITFVIGTLSNGGAERVISILANKFSNLGYNVDILTIHSKEMDYNINDNIKCISFNIKLHKQRIYRPFEIIKRLVLLRSYLKRNKPDILVSFLYNINIYSIIASRFLKVRVLLSERNDPNNDPSNKYIRKFRNFIYKYAEGFVFQTVDAQNYFKYIKNKPSAVIPNPIADYLPEPYHGIRKKEIVSVSRLVPQKNLRLLIKAFSIFSISHPDYTLRVFGRGYLKEDLVEYTKKLGISKKVIFEGFSSNVHKEIIKSKMLVISSDYEGISNAMLEAMALGIPVISTDCPIGGARMFIENEENGLLTKVGDVNDLVYQMNNLVENLDLEKTISENSVGIRNTLSANNITDKWVQIIKEIY